MPFEGKRGLAKRQLPEIILVLVVALAIFGPFTRTTDVAAATIDVEKCRLNTILASVQVSKGFNILDMEVFRTPAVTNPFYIDCPKRYAYVSNDNLKVDKVNTKLAARDNKEKRERQLKELILSEMTKCWKSFGAASDTIYSASAGVGEDSIDVDETACFSCSEIFFYKDFEPVTIKDKDFYEYAGSKKMIIGGQSYVTFLTGGNAPPEPPKEFGSEREVKLDKNQQWSTVFTIKKISVGFLDDKFNWVPFKKDVKKPPVNGGIVDCSVVNEEGEFEDIDSALAYSIGCEDSNPPTINGFVFGKVARGFNKLDINFLGLSTSGDAGLLLFDKDTVRFPMTVRFIPTADVFGDGPEKCKRLY